MIKTLNMEFLGLVSHDAVPHFSTCGKNYICRFSLY